MPYGSWVNDLPTGFFLAVDIAAFALEAGFAWLAFKRDLRLIGTAFSLFAAAELVYMTYHLDWTVFLFARTIAEWRRVAAARASPGRREEHESLKALVGGEQAL